MIDFMALLCRHGVIHHKFRRARKGEDAAMKYCQRCGVSAPVKTRKHKEAA